jgi:hypothetical protein
VSDSPYHGELQRFGGVVYGSIPCNQVVYEPVWDSMTDVLHRAPKQPRGGDVGVILSGEDYGPESTSRVPVPTVSARSRSPCNTNRLLPVCTSPFRSNRYFWQRHLDFTEIMPGFLPRKWLLHGFPLGFASPLQNSHFAVGLVRREGCLGSLEDGGAGLFSAATAHCCILIMHYWHRGPLDDGEKYDSRAE